jgi:hypothetical protein
MTEQELRTLIREAIVRTGAGGAKAASYSATEAPPSKTTGHSSHALFTLPPGDPEGRCMIEPGVACNHCGYCKSYGH